MHGKQKENEDSEHQLMYWARDVGSRAAFYSFTRPLLARAARILKDVHPCPFLGGGKTHFLRINLEGEDPFLFVYGGRGRIYVIRVFLHNL